MFKSHNGKLFRVLAPAFFLMCFLSCEKSDSPDPTRSLISADSNQLQYSVTIDPSNSNNPEDQGGQDHNDALDDLFNTVSLATLRTYDEHDVFDFYGITDQDLQHAIMTGIRIKWQMPADYDSEVTAVYESNTAGFEYYYALRDIIENTSYTLNQKIVEIKKFENSYDYSALSSDMAKTLSITSSIARYSLYYWGPTSQGGLGKFDDVKDELDIQGIDWWHVGVSDILSAAYSGMFTGNPLVALGGGIGGSAIDLLLIVTT